MIDAGPVFVAYGSAPLAQIVPAVLQIMGFEFAHANASSTDDTWIDAARKSKPRAIVFELGYGQLGTLQKIRDEPSLVDVPLLVLSASYVGADLEAALVEAERHDVLAWVDTPCRLEVPLEFLGQILEGSAPLQREHHEHESTHYLVTEVYRDGATRTTP